MSTRIIGTGMGAAMLGLLAAAQGDSRVVLLEDSWRPSCPSKPTVPGERLPDKPKQGRAYRRDPVTGLKLRVE